MEKLGRKWIQAKIQGQNYWYNGQVLINGFTQHFQVGQIYHGYIYEKGVRTLQQLGVYESYREEIVKMTESIRLRKEEQQRRLIEKQKQRELGYQEERRRQEEQLIQFNSPYRIEKGKVIYRKGQSIKSSKE